MPNFQVATLARLSSKGLERPPKAGQPRFQQPAVAAVNAEVPIEGWQLLVDSFFQFSELATL